MKEPQIGIEPMTAWVRQNEPSSYLQQRQDIALTSRVQGTPEPRPNIDKSGNEMATENDTFVHLEDGRRRHEAIVDLLVAEGWNRRGLQQFFREQVKRQIEELRQDPTFKAASDTYLSDLTEWANVREALGSRVPDAWRVVEEGEAHGWGHRVTVLELAEVYVTNGLSQSKWSDYAYLWMTGDSMEYLAVRIYGVDAFGTMHDLVVDSADYFGALIRAGEISAPKEVA